MKVLLICSNYDAFILEEDGRIEEHLFNEYAALNLRYPPFFIQTNSVIHAHEILNNGGIDLVITMLSTNHENVFTLAKEIKAVHPRVPIVALTHFTRENFQFYMRKDTSDIDYIFSWLGNSDLLLAIIKLIEDKMNVEQDVRIAGIQTILLVEDSVRFYSGYLPHIYNIMYRHSKAFKLEGLNNHQQNTLMRGRPKVLLATNYEQAVAYYEKFKDNLLGVITDVSFTRNGKKNGKAGLEFTEVIRKENKNIPILVQSYSNGVRDKAEALGADFLDKKQKDLPFQIREYLFKRFAFGDFIFRTPDKPEGIDSASNLKEFQYKILSVPDECLIYHLNRESFARWLKARALFSIAKILAPLRSSDFNSANDIRNFIFTIISNYRKNINLGVIAKFSEESYDEYSHFSRIGDGSLGGKARGLSFADMLIQRHGLNDKYENIRIEVPKTVVICSDKFDAFMRENELTQFAMEQTDDFEIMTAFQNAQLDEAVSKSVRIFLKRVHHPIAVRSSSVLEDSHYRSFAGVYNTYMIAPAPHEEFVEKVLRAIKSVYASVYFSSSKKYFEATSNVIDEEKMSVILQEINGMAHDNYFYPTISGVARSKNHYPIPPENFNEPVANLAVGFGGLIVEGGRNLRFSPVHPNHNLQLSSPQMAMKSTQNQILVLDLNDSEFIKPGSTISNLKQISLRAAKKHTSLMQTCSHYDMENNILRDGYGREGMPVITFNSILKHKKLPLCHVINDILKIAEEEIESPVEIEFSLNMGNERNVTHLFNLLQIRPFSQLKKNESVAISDTERLNSFIYSNNIMGNGLLKGVYDLLFVKPKHYTSKENERIAELIGEINQEQMQLNRKYILLGPGRWGSSDHNLGIPVEWSSISNAQLIIEMGVKEFTVDPSNGTHFFHNLINMGVGYFTIVPHKNIGTFSEAKLKEFTEIRSNEFMTHFRNSEPFKIKIDGNKKEGVVL